eukprot:746049-Hanusia_phi.AAC.1
MAKEWTAGMKASMGNRRAHRTIYESKVHVRVSTKSRSRPMPHTTHFYRWLSLEHHLLHTA